MKEKFEETIYKEQGKTEEVEEKIKREIPIGLGQTELRKTRETLPALAVDNEMCWVNKDMQLPFKLEEGSSTDLAMFFTSCPPLSQREKVRHLEVTPEHKRSALIGRVIFTDNKGNLYRDIDVKGVGYVDEFKIKVCSLVEEKKFEDRSQTGPWGLVNLGYALTDKEMSEKFLKNHIRTYGIVAIIKLKELIQEGKKISIEQARQRKILREDEEPVLEIRAFGTRMRVQDCAIENALQDGMYLVAQELGIEPKNFTIKEYFSWFCRTLGQQIGRMHKLGYVHGYLQTHNITLDCKIVDLDSVSQARQWDLATEKLRDKDKIQALITLTIFLQHIESLNINSELLKEKEIFGSSFENEFMDAYQKEFNKAG